MSARRLVRALRRRIFRGAKEWLRRRGYYLLRKHYYLPIPDEEDLTEEFWRRTSGEPSALRR